MHRSAGDESIGANAANRVPAAPGSPPRTARMPADEPPPLAPSECVVEIFERFFLHEPELTAELLGELGPLRHRGPREAIWLAVTAP
jgi:hypothetical protein